MNDLLEQKTIAASAPPAQPLPSVVYRLLYAFTWVMTIAALCAGVVLLVSDIFLPLLPHAPTSAAPLLLIGATYLGFQALVRPKLIDICKALIVSAAFILWGIDQLLPMGWFTTTLGDVVIVLYVVDLGWMMADRLRQIRKSPRAQSS